MHVCCLSISDKYRRPWSDAGHFTWRITRAYDICRSIRQNFAVDVTNDADKSCISACAKCNRPTYSRQLVEM